MKKILLIFPNFLIREKFGPPSDPPIGIGLIAAVLESKNYKVNIIDANAENLTLQEIQTRVEQNDPDFVAIGCNYSPLHNPTLKIAKFVKKSINVPLIVGGNHATALYRHILKASNENIDFIVRGEGDFILPLLLGALNGDCNLNEVPGIAYINDGEIRITPEAPLIENLTEIPFPAYHLLPMEKYMRYNIVASRGCPFDCHFCASKVIFKRKVRYRSPENVVDEMEFLLKNYGDRLFWFSDDTFAASPNYAKSFTDTLIQRKLDIKWSCLTRVGLIPKHILQKMKDSGCIYVSYGIESGSRKMLEKMNKQISIKEIKESIKLTREVELDAYGFFILGNIGENRSTITETFKLIMDIKLDGGGFNILIPLPGTKTFGDLIESSIIDINEIKWDQLFARSPNRTYERYSAELASRWCELSASELIDACFIGEYLTRLSRFYDDEKFVDASENKKLLMFKGKFLDLKENENCEYYIKTSLKIFKEIRDDVIHEDIVYK